MVKCDIYAPKKDWYLLEICKLIIVGMLMSYILYRSFLGIVVVSPALFVLFKTDKVAYRKRKQNRFRDLFEKQIQIISGALGAGYSLENAYIHAVEELGKNGKLDSEFEAENRVVINGIRCNRRVEELLYSFGEKSQIDDIKAFASLVAIAKVYGGNIMEIIRKLAKNMEQKNTVSMEIETAISAKKLEGRLMLVMPFIMILYMNFTNGEYVDFLYSTLAGKIIMTVSMLVTVVAGLIINKIVEIEV